MLDMDNVIQVPGMYIAWKWTQFNLCMQKGHYLGHTSTAIDGPAII